MQRFSPRFRSMQFFDVRDNVWSFYGAAMHVGVKTNNYLSGSWHRLEVCYGIFYFDLPHCNR